MTSAKMSIGTSVFAILVVFYLFALETVNGGKCSSACRLPILRGSTPCSNPCRRWAYNASYGQCVSFTYTGCVGDDNNFASLSQCQQCCQNVPACPKYTLPAPPQNCRYKWSTGADGCPTYRLVCECKRDTCSPSACRYGQICQPEVKQCLTCPCPQYRCVSNPCQAYKPSKPCQRCVISKKPCGYNPCPLVAKYENYCYQPTTAAQSPCSVCSSNGCKTTYYNKCYSNPCYQNKCAAYPKAKCYVSNCDCRKYYYVYEGSVLKSNDCGVHDDSNYYYYSPPSNVNYPSNNDYAAPPSNYVPFNSYPVNGNPVISDSLANSYPVDSSYPVDGIYPGFSG